MKLEYEPNTSAKSLTQTRLRRVEQLIGHQFPQSYVSHVTQFNGGIPRQKKISVGKRVRMVERFLCFLDGYKTQPDHGYYDVGVVWSQIEDRLSENLCPFASLFAGDFLCFDFSRGTEPAVVLWDHERSTEENSAITFVAETFDAFVNMLEA